MAKTAKTDMSSCPVDASTFGANAIMFITNYNDARSGVASFTIIYHRMNIYCVVPNVELVRLARDQTNMMLISQPCPYKYQLDI